MAKWCSQTERCELGGHTADCDNAGCILERGETLVIPIREFSGELQGVRDLQVDVYHVSPEGVTPSDITVRIDGIEGQHFPQFPSLPLDDQPGHSIQWNSFPPNPQTMEIIYELGGVSTAESVDTGLYFADFACESEFHGC